MAYSERAQGYQKQMVSYASRFKRNMDTLGFNFSVSVKDGKPSVQLSNVEEKYVPALEKLFQVACENMLAYIDRALFPAYAKREDLAEEKQKLKSFVRQNLLLLTDTLFREGEGAFSMILTGKSTSLEVAYKLSHVEWKNGWNLPGYRLTSQGWLHDGHIVSSAILDTCAMALVPGFLATVPGKEESKESV